MKNRKMKDKGKRACSAFTLVITLFLFSLLLVSTGCLDYLLPQQEDTTTTTTTTSTTSTTADLNVTLTTTTEEQAYWKKYIGSGNLTIRNRTDSNQTRIDENVTNRTQDNQTNTTNASEEFKCLNQTDCPDKKITYDCHREYVEKEEAIYKGEVRRKYVYMYRCRYPGTNRSYCEKYLPKVYPRTVEKCWEKQMVCSDNNKVCVVPESGDYLSFVQERYDVDCECGDKEITGECGEECDPPGDNSEDCEQIQEGCENNGHRSWSRDKYGHCSQQCKCIKDDKTYTCIAGECGAECSGDSGCGGDMVCSDDCMCVSP